MPAEKNFPSIKTLFVESWQAMAGSLFNLFILTLIGGGVWLVFFIISLIATLGVGLLASLAEKNQDINIAVEQYLSKVDPTTFPKMFAFFGLSFLAIIIISCLIAVVTSIASTYAVANYQQKPRLGECLKWGFKLFFPLIIINFVIGLLSFGGWFLFLIPGILMFIFFGFTAYELILGGKRFFEAAKGSVQIVSQNFGEIFLRVILLVILSWVLSYTVSRTFPILSIFFYLIFGWFNVAYHVVLYKQAKELTDETQPTKMGWIWITSILGWLIALLISFGLFKLAQTPSVKQEISRYQQQLLGTAKKDETKTSEDYIKSINAEAKPYWDESQDLFEQMRSSSDNPSEVKKINDKNIAALTKATELDAANPAIWNMLCQAQTWVSTTGSLEKGLEACQKAEELAPEVLSFQYDTGNMLLKLAKWDEAVLKLEKVIKAHENYGLAHYSLGVAYKNLGMIDSAKEHLQKAIDIWENWSKNNNNDSRWDTFVLAAKKELETVGQVKVKSTGSQPTTPNCTPYQIREGEFASNKCYAKKDYDDLMYYLQRFNAAAGSYNGAIASMNITCSGSDFFKDSCERDKKTKADAETNIANYKNTIKGIIARGK